MRSGVLTSVHAFASDPQRGVFILGILVVLHRRRAGAVRLRAAPLPGGRPVRADLARGRAGAEQSAAHRACATVFVGTLYPLALEALTGDKISVGAPFFNLTFPLALPLLC